MALVMTATVPMMVVMMQKPLSTRAHVPEEAPAPLEGPNSLARDSVSDSSSSKLTLEYLKSLPLRPMFNLIRCESSLSFYNE